jgi:putative spermidine/putrescine transport system permease protein
MHRIGRVAVNVWIAIGFAYLLLPLAFVIWMSFFSNEIPYVPPKGYTLRWYAQAFDRSQFYNSFMFSLQVALFATALGLAVSIPATVVLRQSKSRWAGAAVQLLTAPLVVPTIVIGAGIYMSLIAIEIATSWPVVGSLWAFGLAHILITLPWSVRLLLANLATVDESIEEAAASLGATPVMTLFKVTLPMIWSGVVAAGLISFVVSFGNIELSLFLVGAGKTTLPIAVLQYLEWKLDPTVAAVSVAQIILIAVGLLVADRYVKLTRVV